MVQTNVYLRIQLHMLFVKNYRKELVWNFHNGILFSVPYLFKNQKKFKQKKRNKIQCKQKKQRCPHGTHPLPIQQMELPGVH